MEENEWVKEFSEEMFRLSGIGPNEELAEMILNAFDGDTTVDPIEMAKKEFVKMIGLYD